MYFFVGFFKRWREKHEWNRQLHQTLRSGIEAIQKKEYIYIYKYIKEEEAENKISTTKKILEKKEGGMINKRFKRPTPDDLLLLLPRDWREHSCCRMLFGYYSIHVTMRIAIWKKKRKKKEKSLRRGYCMDGRSATVICRQDRVITVICSWVGLIFFSELTCNYFQIAILSSYWFQWTEPCKSIVQY